MSSAFGKVFGSKRKTVTQPTTFGTLPQFGQEAIEDVTARGQALSQDPGLFAPAGFTPEQQQAMQFFGQQVSPVTSEQFQQGLSTFGDPFEEQVIQSAIRDIRETGAGQLSDIATMAGNVGGFGGIRQGILESELQRNVQRSVGDISGRLRSRGFQSAAERTLSDLSRVQEVGGQRAQTLFNIGDVQRQIQTQQRQAPLQAVDFLSQLTQRIPTGGGAIGFAPEQKGLLSRFIEPGAQLVSSFIEAAKFGAGAGG